MSRHMRMQSKPIPSSHYFDCHKVNNWNIVLKHAYFLWFRKNIYHNNVFVQSRKSSPHLKNAYFAYFFGFPDFVLLQRHVFFNADKLKYFVRFIFYNLRSACSDNLDTNFNPQLLSSQYLKCRSVKNSCKGYKNFLHLVSI